MPTNRDRPPLTALRLGPDAAVDLFWLCEHLTDDLGRTRTQSDVIRLALRSLRADAEKKLRTKSKKSASAP